jgi:hypothetical protein
MEPNNANWGNHEWRIAELEEHIKELYTHIDALEVVLAGFLGQAVIKDTELCVPKYLTGDTKKAVEALRLLSEAITSEW